MNTERSVVATVTARSESWVAWPVSWSGIWVGTLAALAVGLVIGLIGTAVGAHQLAEGRTGRIGMLGLVFSVAGAFFAAVVGGWVAAKVAGIRRPETAMLHGAIVFLLGVPVMLLLSGMGAMGYLGTWYAAFGPTTRNVSDAIALRNAALGGVTALLIGLVGSVIGGWMASGEPMRLTSWREDYATRRRRRDIAA